MSLSMAIPRRESFHGALTPLKGHGIEPSLLLLQAIMAFLIGTAKYNPPLRIGLLDEERFSNFGESIDRMNSAAQACDHDSDMPCSRM